MAYIDSSSRNFIGNGEDVVHEILKKSLNLESRNMKELGLDGIYRQVPIPSLLTNDYKENLSEEHGKSSVDILVILDGKRTAIRVQGGGTTKKKKGGHYGDHKGKFDSVQRTMLENSGVEVINIWQHECRNIFKNRLNQKSVDELADSLYGSSLSGYKLTLN